MSCYWNHHGCYNRQLNVLSLRHEHSVYILLLQHEQLVLTVQLTNGSQSYLVRALGAFCLGFTADQRTCFLDNRPLTEYS